MSTVDASLQEYCTDLQKLLIKPKRDEDLFKAIVDSPFKNMLQATSLDLGIVVFLLVNDKTKTIDRIALSNTEPARWSIKMSPVPFEQIKIPVGDKTNLISRAIRSSSPQKTTDWKYLFTPALAPEAARFNQAGAGIACSFVYPVKNTPTNGALIFSYYQPLEHINKRHSEFMRQYTKMVARALASR